MLGSRLKALREEKGKTQEEVSNILNIARGTYAHYEIDKRNPDYDTLLKLADFYDASVDFLLGRTGIRNYQKTEFETKVSHNLDVTGLPEEDIRKVEEYIDLLKKKYNPR